MIVELSREDLLSCLDLVSKGVSQRSPLPILSSVLIRATAPQDGAANGLVELTTTNLELVICLPLAAAVYQPGEIAVPFRVLVDTLKGIADERVRLETDALRFIVRFGSGQAALHCHPAQEFPLTPVVPDEELGVRVPAANMLRLIGRTAFAAADTQERPVLTGVHLLIDTANKRLEAAATDGFRMALAKESVEHIPDYAQPVGPVTLAGADGVTLTNKVLGLLAQAGIETVEGVLERGRDALVKIKGVGEKTVDHLLAACEAILSRRGRLRGSFIAPATSLEVVGRIIQRVECEQVIMYQAQQLTFQIGAALVSTQLIDARFPDYNAVIPNEERVASSLLFVCEALRGALRLTDVLARHAGNTAKIRIGRKDEQTGVFLTAASAEHGDNSQFVPAVLNGEEMELAVNSRYLQEGLPVMGDDVRLGLLSPVEPLILRPDDNPDSFLYLVMPMQFSREAPAAAPSVSSEEATPAIATSDEISG